jgi:hypothetical protein
MKRLIDILRRIFGLGLKRRPLESRINRLSLPSPGVVRKQAGPMFTRGENEYDPSLLIRREAAFLARLEGRHTPRLISAGDNWIEMEHCGEEVNPGNLPADWREQITAISEHLAVAGIVHRDIKQGNVLVRDRQLYLIDFGWAVWTDEAPYLSPRELCEDVPREHIYDNRMALEWLLSSYAGRTT